jgi:cell division protein FtsB
MNFFLRRTGYFAALGIVGVYALIAFRGPQGVPVLREKRKEIQSLQEQNADLIREIDYRRKRIERLRTSQAEQEMEIRDRLKLLRPGETSFILPDQPKTETPSK